MQNLSKRIDIILAAKQDKNYKLQQICKLLLDEVEHYHWVGFYFKNGDKNELILGPYEGAATDHTVIPFGRGICGQVAESNKTYVVQDVNEESNYLSCSIETKAEIVVPIFKNEENIGQIDIDSHYKNSITPKDQEFLESLMIKVAKIL